MRRIHQSDCIIGCRKGILRKQSTGNRLKASQPAICGASDRIWRSRATECGKRRSKKLVVTDVGADSGNTGLRIGNWGMEFGSGSSPYR